MAKRILRLTRDLDARPEAVFRALTEPDELAEWWGPAGFTCRAVGWDLRVGGAYRIEMQPPGGEAFYLAGEFCEIDPPTRLAYTFRWEDPTPDDVETLVTLSLEEAGAGTTLTLTQGAFAADRRVDLHRQGWTESLEKLTALLASGRPARG